MFALQGTLGRLFDLLARWAHFLAIFAWCCYLVCEVLVGVLPSSLNENFLLFIIRSSWEIATGDCQCSLMFGKQGGSLYVAI